jgi:hypothetical protein
MRENTTFREMNLLPSSDNFRETLNLFDPLERANLTDSTTSEGRETPNLLGPLESANH